MEKFKFESKIKKTKFRDFKIKDKIENKEFYNTYRISKVENNKKILSILKVITIPNEILLEYVKQNESIKKEKNIHEYFENTINLIEKNIKKILKLSENKNLLKILDYEILKNKELSNWDIYIQLEDLKLLKNHYNLKEISNKQIIDIGKNICKGIISLHSENIIHGNIKEDSIYINDKGEHKLGNYDFDYEIRNISDEKTINSMPHLPPEIFNKGKYTKGIDIYSLGLYMYKLTNVGRMPFLPYYPNEINVEDILNANSIRMKDIPFPKPLRATKEVADMILKACSFNINNRYKSINDMHIDFEKILTNKTYGENDLKKDLMKIKEQSNISNNNYKKTNNSLTSISNEHTSKYKNSIPTSNSIDYSNSELTLLIDDDSKSENSMSYLGNVIKEASFKKVAKPKENITSYLKSKPKIKRKLFLIPVIVFICSILFLFTYKIDKYETSTGTLIYDKNNIVKSQVSGTIDSINYEEDKNINDGDDLINISTKNKKLQEIETSIKEEETKLTYYDKEIESIESGENLFDKNDENEVEYYEIFDSFIKNVQKSLGKLIKNNEKPKELVERLNTELAEANLYLNSVDAGENLLESTDNIYYKRFEEYENNTKDLKGTKLKTAKSDEIKTIKKEIDEQIDDLVELKKQLKIHNDYYKKLVNNRIEKSEETISELKSKIKDKDDYPSEIYTIKSTIKGKISLITDYKKGDTIEKGDEILEIIPDQYVMKTTLNINKEVKSGQEFDFEITDMNKTIKSEIMNQNKTDKGISMELIVDKDKLGIESLSNNKNYKIKYLSGRENLFFSLF